MKTNKIITNTYPNRSPFAGLVPSESEELAVDSAEIKTTVVVRPQPSGSALLAAILVMGVLMTFGLGISDLIIREIGQTDNMIAGAKAYFAAEAAVENAMLDLSEHLPGYETPIEGGKGSLNDVTFAYKIHNSAPKIPYFDHDKPVFLKPNGPAYTADFLYSAKPEATYNILPLGETVVVPLFTAASDQVLNVKNVENFVVEYYADFCGGDKAGCLTVIPFNQIHKVDILRWKIFGRPKNVFGGSSKTDAISDFFPVTASANAFSPVCFGTVTDLDSKCQFPAYEGGFLNAARECYSTDSDSSLTGNNQTNSPCLITDFIRQHTQNYLVLTNVVNPEVIGISSVDFDKEKTNIYYRIIAKNNSLDDPKLVRHSALIRADGFAKNGSVKQSIDVEIGLRSFLPVFNFSLYQTR